MLRLGKLITPKQTCTGCKHWDTSTDKMLQSVNEKKNWAYARHEILLFVKTIANNRNQINIAYTLNTNKGKKWSKLNWICSVCPFFCAQLLANLFLSLSASFKEQIYETILSFAWCPFSNTRNFFVAHRFLNIYANLHIHIATHPLIFDASMRNLAYINRTILYTHAIFRIIYIYRWNVPIGNWCFCSIWKCFEFNWCIWWSNRLTLPLVMFL